MSFGCALIKNTNFNHQDLITVIWITFFNSYLGIALLPTVSGHWCLPFGRLYKCAALTFFLVNHLSRCSKLLNRTVNDLFNNLHQSVSGPHVCALSRRPRVHRADKLSAPCLVAVQVEAITVVPLHHVTQSGEKEICGRLRWELYLYNEK